MTGLNSERHQAVYDDYGNKIGDTVISITFNPEAVTRLRLMEDWYFDAHRSQLMVRIEAICPVTMRDINDSIQMPNELFWIPFDENTRTVLSEAPVYNGAAHTHATRKAVCSPTSNLCAVTTSPTAASPHLWSDTSRQTTGASMTWQATWQNGHQALSTRRHTTSHGI